MFVVMNKRIRCHAVQKLKQAQCILCSKSLKLARLYEVKWGLCDTPGVRPHMRALARAHD